MQPTIFFGLLPNILSGITFKRDAHIISQSKKYKISIEIFNYLFQQQQNNGALYDSNINSTLDDQYHYANLTLSSIIFYILHKQSVFRETAIKSLYYYESVPNLIKKPSIDFSNFSLLMASVLLPDSPECRDIFNILQHHHETMIHHAVINNTQAYGNNFITMRAVNHLLRYKLLGYRDDEEHAYTLIEASLKWQFSDGIFYDYPRSFHDILGIPSLTYHAKMTLMTLLFGLISKEHHIIDAALRGLDALSCLIAHDGEAFYYGRSNNALYGYASGIYAMQLAAAYLKTGDSAIKYQTCAKKLTNFIMQHKAPDGHLYIVPNEDESRRCGYDSYMYVTVYNAFAMSMLLLSAIVQDIPTEDTPPHSNTLSHLKDSGFIIRREGSIDIALNVKGHNYYQQYLLDPRYTGGTPLYVKYNGMDILPTVPFSYHHGVPVLKKGIVNKAVRIVRRAAATLRQWEYVKRFNPLYAGFLPCIETKEKLYMPLHAISVDVIQTSGMVCLNLSGHLTAIIQKGLHPMLLLLGETIASFINVPLYRLRQLLVKTTTLPFERHIVLGDDFCAFSEHLPHIKNSNYFFSFRTYASWEYRQEQHYVLWGQKNGPSICMPVTDNTIVQQYATVGSSKGWVQCWKIKKFRKHVHARIAAQEDLNIILFFDHAPVSQQVQKRMQCIYAKLNDILPSRPFDYTLLHNQHCICTCTSAN